MTGIRRWVGCAGAFLGGGVLVYFNGGGCITSPQPTADANATTTEVSAFAIGGVEGLPTSGGATADIPPPIMPNAPIPVAEEQPAAIQIAATSICEDQYLRLSNFNVVLGPNAKAIVTDDSVFLSSGWAFLWGHYPWIQTSRASAGAEGSEILVNVDVNPDGTTTEWFFHVEGHTWALPGHQLPCAPETWTDDSIYAVLEPTAGAPTLTPLISVSTQQIFRDQTVATAKGYAAQVGLNEP